MTAWATPIFAPAVPSLNVSDRACWGAGTAGAGSVAGLGSAAASRQTENNALARTKLGRKDRPGASAVPCRQLGCMTRLMKRCQTWANLARCHPGPDQQL